MSALFRAVGCDMTPDVRQGLERERAETRQSREAARDFDDRLFALKDHPFFVAANAAIETMPTIDFAEFQERFAPLVERFETEQLPDFVALIRDFGVLLRPEVRAYAEEMNKMYRWVAGRTQLPAIRAYLDLWRTEQARPAPTFEGVSRNAPCPCGSGKRFKRCHGQLAAGGARSA